MAKGMQLQNGGTHNELGPLRLLLRHLLGLHCPGVFPAEGEVGDGHIVQQQVEVLCPRSEQRADVSADHLLTCNLPFRATALHDLHTPRGKTAASHMHGKGSMNMHKTVRCRPTSRIVRSWLALYCAMTLFRVSCNGGYYTSDAMDIHDALLRWLLSHNRLQRRCDITASRVCMCQACLHLDDRW